MSTFITLGGDRLPVVSQKHTYLKRNLSAEDFQRIFQGDYTVEAHRVLSILIPAMVPDPYATPPRKGYPLWEWEGYSSQEAMDNDEYDEDLDNAPTTAQIVDAFEQALMVAGAGRLGKLLGLVGTMQSLTMETPSVLESSTVS